VTPDPAPELQEYAARLRRLGCGVIVVLLDPVAFGGSPVDDADVARLEDERVIICPLTRGGG